MTRRDNRDGSVTKRTDGRWQTYLTLEPARRLEDGTLSKPKRRYFTGKTRAEALRKLHEAQKNLQLGRPVTTPNDTVEQLLNDYLQSIDVRPRTQEIYEVNVKRLVAHIGSLRLRDLTPSHVRRCYADLQAGSGTGRPLSAYSVRGCHRILHAALKRAVEEGVLDRNVTEVVHAPRPERKEMRTLTVEQLDILWATTEGTRYHALWVLLGTTGLRVDEALGLKWSDIDLERRTLVVQRQVQRHRGEGMVIVPLKSAAAYRTVDIPDLACSVLKEQRAAQLEARLRAGSEWQDNDLIFSTGIGKPLDRTNVYRNHLRALRDAGLPHIRIHDFRHTVATLHLEQGESPKIVQERLGHSNISQTLGTYSHVLPAMHRAAADRLDELFNYRPRRSG